jgi:molecular chaperone DnaK
VVVTRRRRLLQDTIVLIPEDPPFIPCDGDEPFIFVSYAHGDRRRVFEELTRLHRLGYRIWFDRGIRVGDDWPDAIASALDRCSLFLVFMSPAADQSKNVRNEVHFALDTVKNIVAVHLEVTALAPGLRLRLGSMQAIFRHELSNEEYQSRLREALPASLVAQLHTTDRLDTGKILGVDFGTTNSVMAINVGSELRLVLNREGERSTPSVVAWSPHGEWLVGEAAVAQAHTNYANTFYSIKTKLGTGFAVELGGRRYYAHDLAAVILRKMRDDAALYLRQEIQEAVVTHPVRFTRPQKEELILAFQLAGFRAARVVAEPTAVFLGYSAERQNHNKVAIYDLGGGSFDVSIIDEFDGVVECLSVDGDTRLGGDDFDRALADFCFDAFERDHGFRVRDDPLIYRRVLAESERVKKILSGTSKADIELPYLAFRDNQWFHLHLSVSSTEFIKLTAPLVARSIARCSNALEQARVDTKDLAHVILVGLATRMPGLRAELRKFFGQELSYRIDPADAVAIGAAAYGAIMEGKLKETMLLDIIPFSLGVETKDGAYSVMVPRYTTIPTEKKENFRASRCSELGVNVNVFEGERPMAEENHYLGTIWLEPESGWDDDSIFEICFNIDANAAVAVSIRSESDGKERSSRYPLSVRQVGLDAGSRPAANVSERLPAAKISERWLTR